MKSRKVLKRFVITRESYLFTFDYATSFQKYEKKNVVIYKNYRIEFIHLIYSGVIEVNNR